MGSEIFSGLVGAIAGQMMLILWQHHHERNSYRSLLQLIVAECRYNLGILEELRSGVVEYRGSFKRLSVQFLKNARERISATKESAELIRRITTACIDMDLYNRELSYVFNGEEQSRILTGVIEDKATVLRIEPERKNITATIEGATNGVRGSLNALIELIEKGVK